MFIFIDTNHYSALDVADYCLYYCAQKNNPISNLQLQKILYYIQANFLVKQDRPCFSDSILAWKYGPVVEDVYYYYRNNVADEIFVDSYDGAITNDEDKLLINEICDNKSHYSAGALVGMTHSETPWKETMQSEAISLELIKDYFSQNPERLLQ